MRYALGVEYDGSEFQGWQQLGEHGGPSVQASLQAALSSVADAPVQVICAGRTDAGVHGECQVVHFAWLDAGHHCAPAAVDRRALVRAGSR